MLRAITSVERKCSWLIQSNCCVPGCCCGPAKSVRQSHSELRRHGCSRLPLHRPTRGVTRSIPGSTRYLPYRRLPLLPQEQLEETGKNKPSSYVAGPVHCNKCCQLLLAASGGFTAQRPGLRRFSILARSKSRCLNIVQELNLVRFCSNKPAGAGFHYDIRARPSAEMSLICGNCQQLRRFKQKTQKND